MKRKAILLLSILVISSLLFAQGGAKEQEVIAEGPAKLIVWAWDSSFNGYAIQEADKLDDSVEVEFVEMGKAAALQKLHTILASGGATANLPDIVLVSDLHVKVFNELSWCIRSMDSVINYADFAPYKKKKC